jgi:hypothetical protein
VHGGRSITVNPAEQLFCGFPTHSRWILLDDRNARPEQVGEKKQIASESEASRGEFLLASAVALSGGRNGHQVSEIANAPVSVGDQVSNAVPGSCLVVRENAISIERRVGGRRRF